MDEYNCLNNDEDDEDDDDEEEEAQVPCGYDADASNDSTDLNFSSSHEDHHDDCHSLGHAHGNNHSQTNIEHVSKDSHIRGYGEAAARGTKAPFIPISEETIFLDPEPSVPNIATSSPHSTDSWMNYSSHSSGEDYSCISGRLRNNAVSSEEDYDNSGLGEPDSKIKIKRNGEHLEFHDHDKAPTQTQGKRIRGKESKTTSTTIKTNSNNKRRLRRADSLSGPVDVRMIDFAHTTFVRKSGGNAFAAIPNASATIQHHGPDGGFLTGLDSLKRLLSDILAEN